MNLKLFSLFLATIVLTTNIFAQEVSAPFIRKPVPIEGLTIKYNLNPGLHILKLVCVFENFYKGFLTYTLNGKEIDSNLEFGNGEMSQEFVFSNNSEVLNKGNLESFYQFSVDLAGYITVQDTPGVDIPSFATCFYSME